MSTSSSSSSSKKTSSSEKTSSGKTTLSSLSVVENSYTESINIFYEAKQRAKLLAGKEKVKDDMSPPLDESPAN